MARFYVETLAAAERLLARDQGQRGRIAAARIRRSISTSYYALFHFILEECTARVVGTGGARLKRRRIVARVFTHKGIKIALRKVEGSRLEPRMTDYFGVPAPRPFARLLAEAFLRAQHQRHEADYDLNAAPTELDARVLIKTVRDCVENWQAAATAADRDFKQALALLMLLKGGLGTDET